MFCLTITLCLFYPSFVTSDSELSSNQNSDSCEIKKEIDFMNAEKNGDEKLLELRTKSGFSIYFHENSISESVLERLKDAISVQKITDPEDSPITEFYEDIFGYKHNWTDLEDGWTESRRKTILDTIAQALEVGKGIPKFTKIGYKRTKIPDKLLKFIYENRVPTNLSRDECHTFFNCHRYEDFTVKSIDEEFRYRARFEKDFSFMMSWKKTQEEVSKVLIAHLKPILEKWIGGEIPLTLSNYYGVRRYVNGSSLGNHVDKPHTHVISAILQIDQNVNQDWPLTVVDFEGKKLKINLKVGDMFLYESAKLWHGRPFPLNGTYYDNLFVHFRPKFNWYSKNELPSSDNRRTLDDIKRPEQNFGLS